MRLSRSATPRTWTLGWRAAGDHSSLVGDCLFVRRDRSNWRYNFLGANLLVFKLRRLGFDPIRYRQLPFWAWGLTLNFIQHLLLWKFRLRMRTMVDLERIIWRTSNEFVFGNGYNIVLASKPIDDRRCLPRNSVR